MRKNVLIPLGFVALGLVAVACGHQDSTLGSASDIATKEELIARADSFEMNTPYEPVPGNALSHHISGFAKILCSAVFITGLDADFAAENIGYFSAPYKYRKEVIKRVIDEEKKEVRLTLPDGTVRVARYYGDQGCVTLPEGVDSVYFRPVAIQKNLPDAATTAWPMGDLVPDAPWPTEVKLEKVEAALDAAFANPKGMTAAFVVTWKGRLLGERYRDGITMHTPLESWSMGKSLTATLLGTLMQKGVYTLDQPAPIPEWQEPGDPRQEIRIKDILHMSSGLRFRAPQDPDYVESLGYPDHLYVYTDAGNSFHWAATRPQEWPPNTIGRYRNSDPVLTNYLVRLGVENNLQEDYLSYPQRALFDKVGVRDMILETDPTGNFLLQGYEFASGRDWARLGNLYLQDGVWNGERILPEGYTAFVSTLAPAWKADRRPIYGGFFWINGDGGFPIPKDAYFMAGAGGQYTIIIPSHDLVVVRLGHYKGAPEGGDDLNKALALLMEAVPGKE